MEKQASSNLSSSSQANDETDDIFAELTRIALGNEPANLNPAPAPAADIAPALEPEYAAAPLRRPPFNGPIEEIIESAEQGNLAPIATTAAGSVETAMPVSNESFEPVVTPEFTELAQIGRVPETVPVTAAPLAAEQPMTESVMPAPVVPAAPPPVFAPAEPVAVAPASAQPEINDSVPEDDFEFDFGFSQAAAPTNVAPTNVDPAFADAPQPAAPEPVLGAALPVNDFTVQESPHEPSQQAAPAIQDPQVDQPAPASFTHGFPDQSQFSVSSQSYEADTVQTVPVAPTPDLPSNSATMDALENFINDTGDHAVDSLKTPGAEPLAPTPITAEEPTRFETPPKEKKSVWVSYWLPALGGAALIVLAAGAYWTLGPDQSSNVAPVIEAQNTEVRVKPAEPVTDGDSETASPDPSKVIDDIINESTGEENLVVARTVRPAVDSSTAQGTLTNRKVRTVTVRADGTILSQNDGAETSVEPLPTVRPEVSALPDATAPIAANETEASALATALSQSSQTLPATVPALETTQLATAPATTPLTATTGTSSHLVQLSSQRTAEVANRSLAEIKARYASQLGNADLEILRVDLGEKGIFHRVVAAAPDASQGNSICSAIKNAGGDCFVRRR